MEWWLWLAGGLLLLVVELATPGSFFVMFFGLGAVTVGLLVGTGLLGAAWMQWLLFTVSSLAYLLVFRKRLMQRVRIPSGDKVDTLVGELAIPRERIAPGGVGRVELRGTLWNARNVAARSIEPGERSRVTKVDGLQVDVQPE